MCMSVYIYERREKMRSASDAQETLLWAAVGITSINGGNYDLHLRQELLLTFVAGIITYICCRNYHLHSRREVLLKQRII